MHVPLTIALALSGRPSWAVARDADLTPNRLSQFKTGRMTPRADEARRLAVALDLPVEHLFPDVATEAA